MHKHSDTLLLKAGFTLIEMSIVLVIIGLIVGGILVGQNLILSAEVRATISQVEKFNTATNTFYGKFGYLPGDIPAIPAAQFGFASRGLYGAQGDGNGEIEGNFCNWSTCVYPLSESTGETAMFWVDLSSSKAGNLIEGNFNTASSTIAPGADITGSQINLYLPQAKIGRGNYFYVYSGGYCCNGSGPPWNNLGVNYFGLSAVNNIAAASNDGAIGSTANISVAEAYAIDNKSDDGLPQSGRVMAWYLNNNQMWVDGTNASYTPNEPQPYSGLLAGTATTCYDNGGVSGATTKYSVNQNSGAGTNCALSFKFQ